MSRKKRSAPTSLQRKLIIGLGVYLGLMFIAGFWFVSQKSGLNPLNSQASIDNQGQMDLSFLDQLITEMAQLQDEHNPNNQGGAGTYPPILDYQPGYGDLPVSPYDPSGMNPPQSDGTGQQPNSPNSVISADRLSELQDEVTVADRMRALNIVRKKLSAEDIRQLISWTSGGITSDEKEEIAKLLRSRLSPEEISEVKALYNKYQ
ncbi:MAG: hypothetical protein GX755_09865 [Syntrophomonadaceae bacterium]|nr:hypothetical protein [Syntrophomonadaceae bacterium]